jgi:predicted SAM-dependent methyltransferase
MDIIKLHLGCGSMIIPGYVNCDLYNKDAEVKCDAKNLPYEDDSVDEVLSMHLIEHFDFYEAFDVLKEWKRVLKEDGKLHLETPNLLTTCEAFIKASETDRVNLYGQFFAIPWVPGEIHKFLYTETQLRWTLEQVGFKNIITVPALRYIGCENINLGMEAYK